MSRAVLLLGLLLGLLVGAPPVTAQTIYKCGNTYSQTPCGANQEAKRPAAGFRATTALGATGGTANDKAAQDVALAYLRLVDQGRLMASWQDMSASCNAFWKSSDYIHEMGTIARFLGHVETRKLKSVRPGATLDNLGAGRFASVVFDTNHEKQDDISEVVILREEAGRGWRVCRHYQQNLPAVRTKVKPDGSYDAKALALCSAEAPGIIGNIDGTLMKVRSLAKGQSEVIQVSGPVTAQRFDIAVVRSSRDGRLLDESRYACLVSPDLQIVGFRSLPR